MVSLELPLPVQSGSAKHPRFRSSENSAPPGFPSFCVLEGQSAKSSFSPLAQSSTSLQVPFAPSAPPAELRRNSRRGLSPQTLLRISSNATGPSVARPLPGWRQHPSREIRRPSASIHRALATRSVTPHVPHPWSSIEARPSSCPPSVLSNAPPKEAR